MAWRVDRARVGHGPRFPGWRELAAAGAPTDSGCVCKSFPGALLSTPSLQKEKVPGKGPWKMGSDWVGVWGSDIHKAGPMPSPPTPSPPLPRGGNG